TLFFVTEDIKQKGINNIRIQKEYNLERDTVRCDPEKLQQAFLNLCLNAIQSMTCGGDLIVFTRVLGDAYRNEDIQVGIKDSGVGIKKEFVCKIFDPFFTTKQEGTGLGLAIVNKIIEAHNGKIFVESVEGSGTTFSINLPKNNIYDTDSFGDMYFQNEALMPQFL
ncbi:MAG TPA: ATP-binding protein, partial [Candidatus Brocadiaceae bacterium]|nr:ATP-binding protein [Candidatus Brocadiaceae bacterium]